MPKSTAPALLAFLAALGVGTFVFRHAIIDALIDRTLRDRPSALLTDGHLHVILLGTGVPQADPTRAKAGVAIIAGGRLFVFDTGPGVVARAEQAKLPLSQLGAVFFTHYHSDHIGDFGQLVTESRIVGRRVPIEVYGPQGLSQVVDGFTHAFALDAGYRKAPADAPVLHEFTIGPDDAQVVLDQGDVKITAFSVDHEPVVPAVGYRIESAGHVIVISGDTKKSDKVVHGARGADLLIHEATFGGVIADALDRYYAKRGLADKRDGLRQLRAYHSTAVDAAEVAAQAGAKQLVLTHIMPLPNPLARYLYMRGVSRAFTGPVVIGADGQRFDF
jgi:ribonuclease Z